MTPLESLRAALAEEIASWERRRDTLHAYWRRRTMPDGTLAPLSDLRAYDAALSDLDTLCPNMGHIDAEDRCTLAIAALHAFKTALGKVPA